MHWLQNPLFAATGHKGIVDATKALDRAVQHHAAAVLNEIDRLNREGLLRARDAKKMEKRLERMRYEADELKREAFLSVLSDEARLR